MSLHLPLTRSVTLAKLPNIFKYQFLQMSNDLSIHSALMFVVKGHEVTQGACRVRWQPRGRRPVVLKPCVCIVGHGTLTTQKHKTQFQDTKDGWENSSRYRDTSPVLRTQPHRHPVTAWESPGLPSTATDRCGSVS